MLREINIEGRNELNGDQSHKRIPVGTKYNGLEVVKPQTDLDEYEDDTQEDEIKPCSVLKKYQEDVVKKNIENKYSNATLTPEEEKELKEKLFGQDKKVPYVAPECTCATDLTPTKEANLTFEEIANELIRLHKRKNNDYGDAAHESFKEFGLISYIIRLNDKLSRLKSLTKPDTKQMVGDESIIDTLKDLAAYAIMAIESLNR